MWHMGEGWGWWMVFGWIWMAAFWALVIWAVYAVVQRVQRDGERRQPPEAGALEILERRYARGELTTQEFEEMRQRLTAPRPPLQRSA